MKQLFLLLALCFCVGCQQELIVVEDKLLIKEAGTFNNKIVVLENIPLPNDSYLSKKSFCHGTEAFRYGEFTFRGALSVDDVFYYYKEQMPSFAWKEIEASNYETHASLRYEDKDELVTVLCKEVSEGTDIKIIVEQKKS